MIKEKQMDKWIARTALYNIFHNIGSKEKFYHLPSISLSASFVRPPASLIWTVGACTIYFIRSSRRLITDTCP